MKISFAWLKQFIEFNQNITPKEVCTLLTNAGLEVENEIKERVFPQFVTAKILSTQKHPNADFSTSRCNNTKRKLSNQKK